MATAMLLSPLPSSANLLGYHNTFDMNYNNLDVQSALEVARDSETDIHPDVTRYLDDQVEGLWTRLQAEPETYIMNADEFALFNFFIYRYSGSAVTEKAVDRFWRHHQGPPGT